MIVESWEFLAGNFRIFFGGLETWELYVAEIKVVNISMSIENVKKKYDSGL